MRTCPSTCAAWVASSTPTSSLGRALPGVSLLQAPRKRHASSVDGAGRAGGGQKAAQAADEPAIVAARDTAKLPPLQPLAVPQRLSPAAIGLLSPDMHVGGSSEQPTGEQSGHGGSCTGDKAEPEPSSSASSWSSPAPSELKNLGDDRCRLMGDGGGGGWLGTGSMTWPADMEESCVTWQA
ncbi:hypothetical protein ACP4OV_005678 [Aristida adscensionis]